MAGLGRSGPGRMPGRAGPYEAERADPDRSGLGRAGPGRVGSSWAGPGRAGPFLQIFLKCFNLFPDL
jgi:hypothetical protein